MNALLSSVSLSLRFPGLHARPLREKWTVPFMLVYLCNSKGFCNTPSGQSVYFERLLNFSSSAFSGMKPMRRSDSSPSLKSGRPGGMWIHTNIPKMQMRAK